MTEGTIQEHPMIRLNRKKANIACYNTLRRTNETNKRDSGDEADWVREMLEGELQLGSPFSHTSPTVLGGEVVPKRR